MTIFCGSATAAPVATGRAIVVDGDTLTVAGHRIRLWGIDAPEGRQLCQNQHGRAFACGDEARDHLKRLVGSAKVTCELVDRDQYDRAVSRCRAGVIDLGEAMVRAGWAIEYGQFSRGVYSVAEGQARRDRKGLWAGSFERPADWRMRNRPITKPSPSPTACAIKGNINAKGFRIFHAPGQRDYAATSIDTGRGERWFCSATDAVAAGWTPAQR